MATTTTRDAMNRHEMAVAALTYITNAVDNWDKLTSRAQRDLIRVLGEAAQDLRALGFDAPKAADSL